MISQFSERRGTVPATDGEVPTDYTRLYSRPYISMGLSHMLPTL